MRKIYKEEDNPYTLQFSYIPPQYISRMSLTDDIIKDLKKSVPAFRCHFLTGVRGCGKTVLMAEISEILSSEKDWITVDIENPEGNIIELLARGLYRKPHIRNMFVEAKLDFSVMGLGVSVEKAKLIASNELDVLDMMLSTLKKHNKKLLVTIDEVTYCEEIAEFSHALSSYARAKYDIFVLMTGLKSNIKALKNDKSLTFLYRAKEHELEPLSLVSIMSSYVKVFDIDRKKAEIMAKKTRGYSFAFQLLGYLYWNALCENQFDDINSLGIELDYESYLAEFVYDKIWSELSPKEKIIVKTIASLEEKSSAAIKDKLSMDESNYSVYRKRLIDKGVLDGSEYGFVEFKLPAFDNYVLMQ